MKWLVVSMLVVYDIDLVQRQTEKNLKELNILPQEKRLECDAPFSQDCYIRKICSFRLHTDRTAPSLICLVTKKHALWRGCDDAEEEEAGNVVPFL